MLIEPASNVSVPFTVVILTLSIAPERVLVPALVVLVAESEPAKTPEATHKFDDELSKESVIEPFET